jgi:uncharacterized protein (DUF58 family)
VTALGDLRRRGVDTAAVVIDTFAEVAAASAARSVRPAALRLWQLELDQRRATLATAGVPSVRWETGEDAAVALASLARLRRRHASGHR